MQELVTLPLERMGAADTPNRLAESRLPKPFTRQFAVPRVAVRVPGPKAGTDYYQMDMREVLADIIPGFKTKLCGYDGQVPGLTIDVMQGREVVVRHSNRLPNRPCSRPAPQSLI